MALLLLTKAWLEPNGGRIIALTVDHKLRPESSEEAEQINEWMQTLGIEHHILTIDMPREGNTQSTARALRYGALENWCKTHDVLHLFTAHHADDVEETLAMRMWRGSGVEGLAGIPQIRYRDFVRIIRPLLGLRKQALITYLEAHTMPWVEDTSNESDDYERNVVRKQLSQTPLPDGQSARFAYQMALAKKVIEEQVTTLLATSLQLFADGSALLDEHAWLAAVEQTSFSAFSKLIMYLGGADTPPRYRELLQLLTQFKQAKTNSITLGGLLFERSQKKNQAHIWHLSREPSRIESMAWNAQTHILWDKRWMLIPNYLTPIPSAVFLIQPLGEQGLRLLQNERVTFPTHLTYAGKLGLLSIWQLDLLVAVPHIDYWNKKQAPQIQEQFTICFCPAVRLTESPHIYPNQ